MKVEFGEEKGPMTKTPFVMNCCQAVLLRGFMAPPSQGDIANALAGRNLGLAVVLSGYQEDSIDALETAGFKKVASYRAKEDGGGTAYLMVKAPKYHMVRSLKSIIKAAVGRKPRKSR